MMPRRARAAHGRTVNLDMLLNRVARGDTAAFEQLYEEVAAAVYGMALRVLRDPAQSEEVAQEALVEVWRSASRYDPRRGGAMAWIMTLAHRRAVDRVRSEQAATDRRARVAHREIVVTAHDEVADLVADRLDKQRVRDCLGNLTGMQRQSITLAYYDGYTYREVAELLGTPLATVKTRMRDGLIRLRDCMGVEA